MLSFLRARSVYVVLVLAILGGATLIRLADPFFVQALRLIAFDSYQKLDPAPYESDPPVKIVDVDEESLARIGQWPWPRTTMAKLLDTLGADGAAVVAFDILFAEPDRTSPEQALQSMTAEQTAALKPLIAGQQTHDQLFADAIAKTPTILATALTIHPSPPPPLKAGFATLGDDPKAFVPAFAGANVNLAALDQAAVGIGSINWLPDRDQVVRRIPLIYRVGDQYVPTLTTEALRVAQQAGTYVLKGSNSSGETAFGQRTGLNHIRVGAIEIPTDADGGIWLHFRPHDPSAYIPAWKVLSGKASPDEFAGRIVLVGTSAPGLIDLRATPLDAAIPGVEVHAEAIEQILQGAQTGASLSRPDYAKAAEIVLTLALGLILAVVILRVSALVSGALGVAAIASLVIGGWFAFERLGLLFDPTFPAVAVFLLVAAASTYVFRQTEKQRGEVRRAFSYYVSPAVVSEIISHPEKLELGGAVRELTLLFCDVRNFTSISETMTAQELTTFINQLLTPLSEIILDHRGTIDKYMGDAIMAFWNAPLDDPDHAAHACQSAVAMVQRMKTLNREWRGAAETAGRPYKEVAIGIGINSGDCCVGNLGSVQRFDYSAIGDDVNVASRLEGQSKVYGVPLVIGESSLKRMPPMGAIELDVMRVKGKAHPARIYTLYEVLDGPDNGYERLAPLHAAMLAAYRGREWDAAERVIGDCEAVGVGRLATLYRVYRARIAEWRAAPPPPDWDGTFTATSK
jgi:adenylate cyclase